MSEKEQNLKPAIKATASEDSSPSNKKTPEEPKLTSDKKTPDRAIKPEKVAKKEPQKSPDKASKRKSKSHTQIDTKTKIETKKPDKTNINTKLEPKKNTDSSAKIKPKKESPNKLKKAKTSPKVSDQASNKGDSQKEARQDKLLLYKEELQKILKLEQKRQTAIKHRNGQDFCETENCDYPALIEGHCRIHFFAFYPKIIKRKEILEKKLLEKGFSELYKKHSLGFLEKMLKDLSSEKNFHSVLKKINLE